MKNKVLLLISLLLIMLVIIAGFRYCSNKNEIPTYEGKMNPEVIKQYSNTDIFSTKKLDSLDFVNTITSQKIQELYDLVIVSLNNKDKKLHTILNNQLKNYFLLKDSISLLEIKKEIDSLQVGYAKLKDISILEKNNLEADSIGKVNFSMLLYKKDKKYLTTINRSANYILKKNPEKLKKEFKYYFTSFGKKDTIREGVIK